MTHEARVDDSEMVPAEDVAASSELGAPLDGLAYPSPIPDAMVPAWHSSSELASSGYSGQNLSSDQSLVVGKATSQISARTL